MSKSAVIGMLFGDEGKGVVTDYICSKSPDDTLVVRFSGGQQATHTVYKDNIVHRFSQFGSGTLRGCPTYWSKFCTFDPYAFREEHIILEFQQIYPDITIHPGCPVTTPYDVFANRNMEKEHGTCGTGIYRTKKRHFYDKLELPIWDILYNSLRFSEDILKHIRDYYKMEKCPEEEDFLLAVSRLKKMTSLKISGQVPNASSIVFEGSQGLMLDEHIGYMPHCTPSDVTPRNALKLSGGHLDEVYLVVRAYTTRHGNGPMLDREPELKCNVRLKNTEHETNETNEFQGEFRTAILDLEQMKHAKREGIDKVVPKDTRVNLVMTCTDQLAEFPLRVNSKEDIVYNDVNLFISRLGRELNVNGSLFINDSPYSETIRESDFWAHSAAASAVGS